MMARFCEAGKWSSCSDALTMAVTNNGNNSSMVNTGEDSTETQGKAQVAKNGHSSASGRSRVTAFGFLERTIKYLSTDV